MLYFDLMIGVFKLFLNSVCLISPTDDVNYTSLKQFPTETIPVE